MKLISLWNIWHIYFISKMMHTRIHTDTRGSPCRGCWHCHVLEVKGGCVVPKGGLRLVGSGWFHHGNGIRRSPRKHRDKCMETFITLFAQLWLLGIAPTAWCPAGIVLLAATELREIWNVILEHSLRKPHRISMRFALPAMMVNLVCKITYIDERMAGIALRNSGKITTATGAAKTMKLKTITIKTIKTGITKNEINHRTFNIYHCFNELRAYGAFRFDDDGNTKVKNKSIRPTIKWKWVRYQYTYVLCKKRWIHFISDTRTFLGGFRITYTTQHGKRVESRNSCYEFMIFCYAFSFFLVFHIWFFPLIFLVVNVLLHPMHGQLCTVNGVQS